MDSQQYWFSSGAGDNSGGGGGDDFGEPIGQSLRFRGGQVLTQPVPSPGSTTWTLSLWVKKCQPHGWLPLFTPRDGRTGSVGLQFSIGSPANIGYQTLEVGGAEGSTAQFRDPSAWYHVVCQCDRETSLLTIFVNGDQVVQGATTDQMDFADNMRFMHGQTGFDTNTGHFYLAETYLIDGQSLEPTAFGRLSEKGVWVPKKVDFAYSSGSEKYSSYLTVSNGNFITSPTLAFNGDVDPTASGTGRCYTDQGADITWAPETPVPFTTSLEIFNTNQPSQQEISWDGNTVQPTGGWVTVYSGSGEVSKAKPLTINSVGAQRSELHAVRIDGQLVNDPYLWSSEVTLIGSGSEGGFNAPPTRAFDGDTSTPCVSNSQNQSIKWVPSTPISYNQSVEVWTGTIAATANTCYLYNEGVELASVANETNTWTTLATGSGVFDDLRVYGQSGQANLSAVRIDGKIYVDGSNPSFGPNGFHLNFSDPTDVGRDFSGNGNDFTAVGFVSGLVTDWQDTSVYSDAYTDVLDWTTTKKDSINPASWKSGFDGNLDTYAFGDNSSGAPINESWLQFRPPSPIQVNTSARIYLQYPHGCKIIDASDNETTISVDEGNINYWQDLNFTGLLKGIAVQSSTGYAARWAAIEIDGQILLNVADVDYDVMTDSPTQNYNTGNSIHVNDYTNSTLSKGNLAWAAQGTSQRSTTQTINRGKWYWEATCTDNVGDQYPQVGFGSLSNNISANSVVFGGRQYYDYTDGSPAWKNYDAGMVLNQPQGYAYDSETGTVTITNINGETTTHVFNGGATGIWRDDGGEPLGAYAGVTSGQGIVYNFGQQPFTYDVPEGYLPLQSQSSTAKSILNGRDHFQALTGPGDGPAAIDPATQIYVNSYQPGPTNVNTPVSNGFNGDLDSYVWVDYNVNGLTTPLVTFDTPMTGTKFEIYVSVLVANNLYVNGQINSPGPVNGAWVDISAQANGSLSTLGFTASGSAADGFSALRIDDKVVIESGILARAQAAFPNGLWWIKDRANDNDHQMVYTGSNGNAINIVAVSNPSTTPYAAPAGNSVAWCWKAGDSEVANNDGSIASNVRVNEKAGFSIVRFTGTETAGSVGHGLTGDLDMMIITPYQYNSSRYVWHRRLTSHAYYMYLQNTDPEDNSQDLWGSNDFDNGVFSVSSSVETNKTATEMVAFCWKSIPGYSAFGRYEGNTDEDGPFVYTGFKVAFLLFKRTDGAYAWEIRDTTRTPNNPSNFTLYPNYTWKEAGPDPATDVDLLSNGFKLRNNTVNGNQGTIIYAAFAENPFHYPVTAR